MTSWRRYAPEIEAAGAELVAVSTDGVPALRVFAAALGGFPFPLLGDRGHQVSRLFGVLDADKGYARRATFIVGPDGRVTFANPAFAAGDPAHYEAVVAHLKGGR